jgi:NNP family nitrate/nitrite transporter-like MFS transporter
MPSTNLFFPKRLKGTALGIQAGIGNFGVSLVQFLTPIVIGFGVYGSSAMFTKVEAKDVQAQFEILGKEQTIKIFSTLDPEIQGKVISAVHPKVLKKFKVDPKNVDYVASFEKLPPLAQSRIYLQTAAFWYVPFLLIFGFLAWMQLKSIPVKASIKEQFDIFGDKHTWYCTITYLMTFGSFAGLAAAFPMLIKTVYGPFPDAPDPLVYAFYGPLIGSASRVLFGFVADKVGGAILTTISGIGLIVGCGMLVGMDLLDPTSLDQFPMFVAVMLGLFFFTGIGNAATFRQYPIIFQHNTRQAAGVIGWTAAIAAFGPFIFAMLILTAINASGTPNPFFIGLIVFSLIATLVNWYFYQRKGCERPS